MSTSIVLGIIVIASVLPSLLYGLRQRPTVDSTFWMVASMACIGPAYAVFARSHGEWQIDFATSIWVTMAATALIFILFSAFVRDTWRLIALFAAYMLVLAAIGFVWQHTPPVGMGAVGGSQWLILHIGFAVVTYALVTLSAIAGLAAFIQERALKNKTKPALEVRLPAITDCDRLVTVFLTVGEIVLGLGMVSGIALNIAEGHSPLVMDHKTVFTVGAFVMIGGLLITQARYGMRGRRAARIVLLAYLLLTLAYPGVKFVSDVLIG
jgi:ABC-type uncharacterized transport system permease subunit